MSKELRECPFCGGEDVEHLPDGFGNWLVGCVTCDYRIQCVSCTEEEGIRYWNTRPAEDALTAEVERLKRKLKNLKCHLTALRDSLLLTVNDEVDLERSFAAEQRIYLYNGLIELINAPDMNDGTMADCVKQNGNHDTQADLCKVDNTESEAKDE